ncbi:MAG: potassium transporter TrkG [Pseudomonadota bacterium]
MPSAATRIPLLVKLAGMLSLSMYVPAIHALLRDAHFEARVFFYWGTIGLALVTALAVATARHQSRNVTRSHLVALLSSFALLPALAAIPLTELLPDTRFINAYVEMVAATTTTGGSVFAPERLSETGHLWRALIGWQGGFLVWVSAVAILAPLQLGGYEITRAEPVAPRRSNRMQAADPEERVHRYAWLLMPIYLGLTALLAAILTALGESPTHAAIRAMSTISTSGITPGGTLATPGAGIAGEVAIAAFLIFAISRQTFDANLSRDRADRLREDRELRIAAIVVLAATTALFVRHWIGAYEVDRVSNLLAALGALWGAAFTTLSFLTTVGFESSEWATARAWSGLDAPAVLLAGLALFGGGVATTAGGVKLLRIYALYTHGRREMMILVHPHAVAGGKGRLRHLNVRGIEAAWIFFMLFAFSLAVITLALGLGGLSFDHAVIVAVAALSTAGPLIDVAGGPELNTLHDFAKAVVAAAMVIGRLETLALIALFNPDFWRS